MTPASEGKAGPLILHHFPASPFAEKLRLALGLKGLSWHSVELPMVMPKPDLVALTGGYRKTPVLQIGADVYCDTQRIAVELERRYPSPTLFPGRSAALAMALSAWSDGVFFRPGAALSMGTNPDIPDAVLRDRQAFFSFLDFSTLAERLPHFFSQFQAQVHLLNRMLNERGPFLFGEQPAWADILAYFPVWMARGNIRESESMLAPLGALQQWEERVRDLGHGHSRPLSAQEALDIAADSHSYCEPCVQSDVWPEGLVEGDAVCVQPDDYGADPVTGSLLRLTDEDVSIEREHERVGKVVVHFPRTGFELRRA